MWPSTVRTDSDMASAMSRLDRLWATSRAISRSRPVSGRVIAAAARAGETAPPHCSASRRARPAADSALPRSPVWRYPAAACAAASAAANPSPMSSNSRDATSRPAWSPAARARAYRAAIGARGPSTRVANSSSRSATPVSPNWAAVCNATTSRAHWPWSRANCAAPAAIARASPTRPRAADTHAPASSRPDST